MQAFTIHGPAQTSGLRFRDTTIDTSIHDGVASAKVTTQTGVTNPAYILSTGALGKAALFERTKSNTVTGNGSSPLDDAVTALHAIGDEHGITGINLSTNPSLTGTVQFADRPGVFVGGGDTAQRAGGQDVLRSLDAAARSVLDLATKG